MSNIFAGSEIVELGIQIEKNGKDFYNTLATQSKNEKAKKLFQFLAGEEDRHISVFQGIFDKMDEKYEPPELYPGEYFAYMKVLASEYVFTQKDKGKEIAEKVKDDKEAVDLGIKFEKDSILFYVGLKETVSKTDQKTVDQLIMQEQSHLKKLSDLKITL